MFRSQQIIIREYACTSLKLLNYLKTEFKILKTHSRCCGSKTCSQYMWPVWCCALCSFLCHTHTDGKDKLLEWPDRSCLLLYV